MSVPSVRVLGFGRRDRRDDGAGLVAAARLRALVPAGVAVEESSEPLRLLDMLDGATIVVAIDAVHDPSGRRPPGSLVRVEVSPGAALELRTALSTHGMGLAEALGLAFALGSRPHVVIHGVEVADVAYGTLLSPPVAAAIPSLVEAARLDVIAAA